MGLDSGRANLTSRLTYVGHATVLLELDGVRLLTDPVLRGRVAHLRRYAPPPPPGIERELDAVLISHLHLDHLDLPSLRLLDRDTVVVAPAGAGSFIRAAGFSRVVELAPGQATEVAGAEITATPALHDSRRRPLGGPVAEPVGYDVRAGLRTYFAGDTDLFPEMAGLSDGLDLALLPVWGWGAFLGSGHLDPERAARAAALLRPRLAVPIHWGSFFPFGARAGGLLSEPPREFASHVAELAPDVEVRVIEPGDSTELTN